MFIVGNQKEYIILNLSHYILLSNNTKLSGYRIEIKFDKDALVTEQNKYLTRIVNVSIDYDLNYWPKIPLINFTTKNSLFGGTSIVQNSDQESFAYSGYGIAFDGKGEWSFGNEYARKIAN